MVGAMASAFGAGAGVAFLFLGLIRRLLGVSRQGSMGLLVIAVSMLSLAASPAPEFAIASLVLGGMGYTFALTALTTGVQQLVDEDMRGRVMALWAVAFLGSRPPAAAANGAVADLSSPVIALLLTTAVVVGGAVLVRPSKLGA